MDLDEILGIDTTSPVDRRAKRLLDADRRLLADLVARRKQLKLSQAEVARRMDIGQSAVARIESGVRDLHQSTLRRYAMAVESVVEHQVVPDDPGLQRSAKIIQGLRDQLQRTESEVWAGGIGEIFFGDAGKPVTWRAKDRQPVHG